MVSLSSRSDYLALLRSRGVSTTELSPILEHEGNVVLSATAGSGKTTTLGYTLLSDILFGALSKSQPQAGVDGFPVPDVLVSTFVKSGAKDLSARIRHMVSELGLFDLSLSRVSFRNLHSEFLSILNDFGVNTKNPDKLPYYQVLGSGDLGTRILKQVFKEFSLGANPSYPNKQELGDLAGAISYYRNTIFSEPSLAKSGIELEGLSDATWGRVVARYKDLCRRYQVLDFDDMVESVYTLCVNQKTAQPHLRDAYLSRYRYVMLDEFQDVSELQYATILPLLQNAERAVVVGDVDQSIYSFQAASPELLPRVVSEIDAQVFPLSVSYRCPSAVLTPMGRLIQHNQVRLNGELSPFRDGGVCHAVSFGRVQDMVSASLSVIDHAVASGQTVAVVSRTNNSVASSVFGYILRGQRFGQPAPFALYGSIQPLSSARYKRVWEPLLACLSPGGIESLADLVRLFEPKLPVWRIRNAVSALPDDGKTPPVFFLHRLATVLKSKSLESCVSRLGDEDLDEMTVARLLLEHLEFYASPAVAPLVPILSALFQLSDSVSDVYANIDTIDRSLRGAKSRTSQVSFATVHGFKGKQADVVVVFDASDSVFPSSLAVSEDEERSIFFVAGTRALHEVYYFSRGSSVSPFLSEAGIKPIPVSNADVGFPLVKEEQEPVPVVSLPTQPVEVSDGKSSPMADLLADYFNEL